MKKRILGPGKAKREKKAKNDGESESELSDDKPVK